MPEKSLTTEQVLTLLAATPQRIAALTADLSSAQLRTKPNQNEWSANDVLAHMRACADVWGNCIAAIIAEDRPVLRAVNPTTWIKKTDYDEWVCMLTGPMLYFFWSREDWYDYLELYKRPLRRFTLLKSMLVS